MALTKGARALNVEVHGVEGDGTRLPNGLIKTGRGLVVPPSTSGRGTDTHTGALAPLTDEERGLFGIPDEPAPEPVREPPAPAARKPRRRAQPQPEPQERPTVRVRLVFPEIGVLPFEYAHRYDGDGVVVLGMSELSYMPKIAVVSSDGGVAGAVRFADSPEDAWLYLGQKFVDREGVENIILAKMPERSE